MQTLHTITTKQTEILKLLYTYRFLTRPQLQKLLNHKDKRRITSWLQDLRNKQFIDWKYNADDFIEKTKPAIYFISLGGIRYLRSTENYPSHELKKHYKNKACTKGFIEHCLVVADCCLALREKCAASRQYTWTLPSGYTTLDHSLQDNTALLNDLQPHLYFTKQDDTGITHYVVENIAQTTPRYQVRKRINQYIDFLAIEWVSDDPAPIALFICASKADLIYIKRRVKMLLSEIPETPIIIRVATIDSLKANGITGHIWEEV